MQLSQANKSLVELEVLLRPSAGHVFFLLGSFARKENTPNSDVEFGAFVTSGSCMKCPARGMSFPPTLSLIVTRVAAALAALRAQGWKLDNGTNDILPSLPYVNRGGRVVRYLHITSFPEFFSEHRQRQSTNVFALLDSRLLTGDPALASAYYASLLAQFDAHQLLLHVLQGYNWPSSHQQTLKNTLYRPFCLAVRDVFFLWLKTVGASLWAWTTESRLYALASLLPPSNSGLVQLLLHVFRCITLLRAGYCNPSLSAYLPHMLPYCWYILMEIAFSILTRKPVRLLQLKEWPPRDQARSSVMYYVPSTCGSRDVWSAVYVQNVSSLTKILSDRRSCLDTALQDQPLLSFAAQVKGSSETRSSGLLWPRTRVRVYVLVCTRATNASGPVSAAIDHHLRLRKIRKSLQSLVSELHIAAAAHHPLCNSHHITCRPLSLFEIGGENVEHDNDLDIRKASQGVRGLAWEISNETLSRWPRTALLSSLQAAQVKTCFEALFQEADALDCCLQADPEASVCRLFETWLPLLPFAREAHK